MISSFKKNRIEWEPSEKTLPIKNVQRPFWLVNLAIVFGGLLIIGLFLTGAVGGYLKQGFKIVPFLSILPVAIGGLCIFVYGLSRFFHTKVTTIFYNRVEFTEILFFKKKYWREPIFNYEGVERRSRHLTVGGDTSAHTEYEVVLKHQNPKKEVQLFYSMNDSNWGTAWTRFAKLLNLALIELEKPNLQSLPQHNRDNEVADFGNRIWIEKGVNSHRVCHKRLWSSWPASLGIIFTGFLYLAISGEPSEGPGEVPLSLLLGFFSLFFLAFLLQVFSTEELVLNKTHVIFQIRYPWKVRVKKRLLRETIKKVFVKVDPHRIHLPSIVYLEGAEGIVHFGRYATEKDKEQLKNFLLHELQGPQLDMQAKGA